MPPATLLAPTPLTCERSEPAVDRPSIEQACLMALGRARVGVANYLAATASAEKRVELIAELRSAAAIVAQLGRQLSASKAVIEARALICELNGAALPERLAAGLYQNIEVTPETQKGWPGLLARMLLVPAWQSPPAPALENVPDWLWGDYVAWLFRAPAIFSAPCESDVFAAHFERRAEELCHWIERNPGATAVRSAWESYLAALNVPALQLSASSLRKHAEAHARMLARMTHANAGQKRPAVSERSGRKLKVGFILQTLADVPATFAALPLFAQLDPARFEVSVYTAEEGESRARNYAQECVASLATLPSDTAEAIAMLSSAGLDCLVFGAEIAMGSGGIAKLACHRIAALQVATSAHDQSTTGFSNIDLFVAGEDATALADQFSERLALVPGPMRTFNHDFVPAASGGECDRSVLGLPVDAPVFVSAATFGAISAETRFLWTRVLATTPGSYLVIQRLREDATSPEQLGAEFERLFVTEEIDSGRLVICAAILPTMADVKMVLRLGDVYLDASPCGDDVAMISALEVGLPVVTLEGSTMRSRRGAAMLRSLEMHDAIASDGRSYSAIAADLGLNTGVRAAWRERVTTAMTAVPRMLDALAASDGFGAVLDMAYDEFIRVGSKAFAAQRAPLRIELAVDAARDATLAAITSGDYAEAAVHARTMIDASPSFAEARALLGQALVGLRDYSRAVDYLLSAVQQRGADVAWWFDLSRALRENGQMPQAVQALETGLRLDPSNADGWLMLVDVAERAGVIDLAQDAVEQLRKLAPHHSALESLSLRLGC